MVDFGSMSRTARVQCHSPLEVSRPAHVGVVLFFSLVFVCRNGPFADCVCRFMLLYQYWLKDRFLLSWSGKMTHSALPLLAALAWLTWTGRRVSKVSH